MSFAEKTAELFKVFESIEDRPAWVVPIVGILNSLVEEIKHCELSKLTDKIAVQETVTTRLQNDNRNLRQNVSTLKTNLKDLEEKFDEIEQHGRNVNLVLRGLKEEKNEDTTEKFVSSLNEHFPHGNKLKKEDIARSHRLGRFDASKHHQKPRPIIARFARETKKIATYKVKRNLKGKGISLAENLTKRRADVYRKAMEILPVKTVWTWEGRIFATHPNDGQQFQIKTFHDIPGYVVASDSEESDGE